MICKLGLVELEYLGDIITNELVKTEPYKIEKITKWSDPSKQKELQTFLGLYNYYSH